MSRTRRAVGLVAAALAVAATTGLAQPAAAGHDQHAEELWVVAGISAAGGDTLWVTDESYSDSRTWSRVATDVAVALGHPVGSFEAVESDDAAFIELDAKLAQPDAGGGLTWALDTAGLQRVAEEEGYEGLLLEVCTPLVRQVVDAEVRPTSLGTETPGTRCREWHHPADAAPLRAVVRLFPDRDRYPVAVGRALGAAGAALIVLGIAAAMLRRGPLRRRNVASWLVSVGAAGGVGVLGWGLTTLVLWLTGASADPMLLGRGGVGEQVARTVAPGLAFLLPALLPGALLLSVPRRERTPPAPLAPPGWSPQWGGPPPAPVAASMPAAPPSPWPPLPPVPLPLGQAPAGGPPSPTVPLPPPPPEPGGSSGWAAPR